MNEAAPGGFGDMRRAAVVAMLLNAVRSKPHLLHSPVLSRDEQIRLPLVSS